MAQARKNQAQAVEEAKELDKIEVPADAEEITEEEAKALEEKAVAPEEVEEAQAVEEAKEEEEEEGAEYEIHAPNKAYSGVTATVEFKDGIGRTQNKVIADYFADRKFEVKKV